MHVIKIYYKCDTISMNVTTKSEALKWKLIAELHPSLARHVQNSLNTLYVPFFIMQYLSSPPIPGSPK